MQVDFQDIPLPLTLVGTPRMMWLGQDRLVVSDFTGRLNIVSYATGELLRRENVELVILGHPIGAALRSLQVFRGEPNRCAVATSSPSAIIWTPDLGAPVRIQTQSGQASNAVALSEDGSELLIGTGYYPLGPHSTAAVVERWTLDPEPVCRARQRLPGVAVDSMAWDARWETVVVAVGAESQDRGYLALLEPGDLRITEIFETDFCSPLAMDWRPWSQWLTIAHRTGVERYDPSDLGNPERLMALEVEGLSCALSPSGEELLLSSGRLCDLWNDEEIALPALPGATAVCFGPPGMGFGITQSGLLRRWSWQT